MIASHRVFLKAPTYRDVAALLDLHQRSRDFHFPWAFLALTETGCQDYIQRCQGDDYEGLLICRQEDGAIVGVANLSQIFYKAFQNAYLGYYSVSLLDEVRFIPGCQWLRGCFYTSLASKTL